MYNGSNWDRKPQLSDILTDPLNPRWVYYILNLDWTDRQQHLTFSQHKHSQTNLLLS